MSGAGVSAEGAASAEALRHGPGEIEKLTRRPMWPEQGNEGREVTGLVIS